MRRLNRKMKSTKKEQTSTVLLDPTRQKDSKVEGYFPPIPPLRRSRPEEEAIPCSMKKLTWNLYKSEKTGLFYVYYHYYCYHYQ